MKRLHKADEKVEISNKANSPPGGVGVEKV